MYQLNLTKLTNIKLPLSFLNLQSKEFFKFKFIPLMLCDVERSFSKNKIILRLNLSIDSSILSFYHL